MADTTLEDVRMAISELRAETKRGFDDLEGSIGDEAVLRILVEKDWSCITARRSEEDMDTFPKSNTSC